MGRMFFLLSAGGASTSVMDLRTPVRGRSSSGSERPSSSTGSASSLRGLRAEGGTVFALCDAMLSRAGGGDAASAPRAVLGATAETGAGSGATEPGALNSV